MNRHGLVVLGLASVLALISAPRADAQPGPYPASPPIVFVPELPQEVTGPEGASGSYTPPGCAGPGCAVPAAEPGGPAWEASQAGAEVDPTIHIWGGADYLWWWVKNGEVVPLVTRNPTVGSIAALNEPGTQILFGGSSDDIEYPLLSGGRFTIGAGRDGFGIQGSFLFLIRESLDFVASSPGNVALGVPLFATVPFGFNPAGETSFNGGGAPLTVAVNTWIQLLGAELNGVINGISPVDLGGNMGLGFSVLGGFRYVYLREGIDLTAFSPDELTGGQLLVRDSFSTRDDFYGGQLGLRTVFTKGIFSLDFTSKIALGGMHQSVSAAGFTSVTNGAFGHPSGTYGAGIFATGSNSGKYDSFRFAYVPEVRMRLGVDFTENIRGSVGYNFLYLSSVVRASSQIDRFVNPTQNQILVAGATPSGALAPVQGMQRTDFWAHGMTVGLEFRY